MTAGAFTTAESPALTERVDRLRWEELAAELDAQGAAVVPGLLAAGECDELRALYEMDGPFRSRVVMARHGYGSGEYRYFGYPLPSLVAELRTALYPHLVPLANAWHATMRLPSTFPDAHADFLERCRAAGQSRPTPLLLRYVAEDYNRLHQDLYGENVFPMQVAVLLSEPGRDFTGGEFVMTEQRPRMQTRPMVLHLRKGDAVVFAVRHRPVMGKRGSHRVNLRHGVSRLRSGERTTLGIIFHDAT
ncbi:MAG TPA: 2OG-Fe(II) oxygenase [Polyangiaceae bacterium]